MTFCYIASFDVADYRNDIRDAGITFSRSGSSDFAIDVNSTQDTADGADVTSVFSHYGDNPWTDIVGVDADASTGIRRSVADSPFSDLVTTLMRAAAAIAGWPNPSALSCTFSTTTLRYVFVYAGDAFDAIVFGNDANADLFGFTGVNPTSGETVTADTVPMFVVVPELSAVSTPGTSDGIDYEPQLISASAIATMGAQFGITRSCVPTYRDWTQQSEPREKTLRFAAQASGGPKFSHQELFESCRCVLPFVVVDGFGDGQDYLMRLRSDTCLWSSAACRRAANDMDDAHFDVRYGAQVLGVFV